MTPLAFTFVFDSTAAGNWVLWIFAVLTAIVGIGGMVRYVWRKGIFPMVDAFRRVAEGVRVLQERSVVMQQQNDELKHTTDSTLTRVIRLEKEIFLETTTSLRREFEISQMKMSAVANILFTAVFYTDADGKCVFANQACADIFDQSPHEMLAFGWLHSVAPEFRTKVKDEWTRAVSTCVPYEMVYDVRRRNETVVAVRAKAEPYKTRDDGRVAFWFGTVEVLKK